MSTQTQTPYDIIKERLSSIIVGVTVKTGSGQLKWMNEYEKHAKDGHKWAKEEESLDETYCSEIYPGVLIHCNLHVYMDHTLNYSHFHISSDLFQSKRIYFSHLKNFGLHVPEAVELEKIIYNEYFLPKLKKYKKNINTDIANLDRIVEACGIEAVRDSKISQILAGENIFKKIFKR